MTRLARPADGDRLSSGTTKYSILIARWLRELGYTHCFFVAGGNIMHLLDAVRSDFVCVPFVHEVAAGIAAEYFNESADPEKGRAFALVTAGPGLTNIITAIAGAWLESRDLLVLGGQVKTTDLATGALRQRGIQEIDGPALTSPICKVSTRFIQPVTREVFRELVLTGTTDRKGPVFIEFPLDVQGAPVEAAALTGENDDVVRRPEYEVVGPAVARVADHIRSAKRPVILLGGGVSRETARALRQRLLSVSVALMTTYNGADRLDARDENYFGRPNTWGQRSANIILQQADIVIAVGTRLGLQQTGFNWEQFAPLARVVQVDVDRAELDKGHPRIDDPICADANSFLSALLETDLGNHEPWLEFATRVRETLPLAESANTHASGFIDPYEFYLSLSERSVESDIILPCSSGGTFTVAYQSIRQRFGQIMISDKSLASMGYGLSGAIGAALAQPGRRVIQCEGDGGFAQNLQELATLRVNDLNVKLFIFSNEGYASIRMTQKNYFGGAYLGCDTQTGLGFPKWDALFAAYDIPLLALDAAGLESDGFAELFDRPGPTAFIVPIDPAQTYFPKISSRVTSTGSMESNPLHLYTPDLDDRTAAAMMPYLVATPNEIRS